MEGGGLDLSLCGGSNMAEQRGGRTNGRRKKGKKGEEMEKEVWDWPETSESNEDKKSVSTRYFIIFTFVLKREDRMVIDSRTKR